MTYLPKQASIDQSCDWLSSKTGESWMLSRLLEYGVTPRFWLEYKAGYPAIFGDNVEGYLTRMVFAGDLCRLEADGGDALVNMFAAHDDVNIIKVEPGMVVPLSELRFKRSEIEELATFVIASRDTNTGALEYKATGDFEVPPAEHLVQQASGDRADGLKPRERQIRAIEAAIHQLQLEPMSIPKGWKSKVEALCRAQDVDQVFGGGHDPFKKAWQAALNQNRVRTKDHAKYAKR